MIVGSSLLFMVIFLLDHFLVNHVSVLIVLSYEHHYDRYHPIHHLGWD